MDLIVAGFPIILLIYMMTKKNSVPSHVALPLTAALVYGIKLIYFGYNPNLINATVVNGLLTAWTPILIIWGAILLFKTMEHSGGMVIIRAWLNAISNNRIAQLMIIGWAFAFLIEGASGFGTPPALAAPILVGLGFKPLKVAILCLMMNTVPVSFGAVGTPTWFGFGELGLDKNLILDISFYSALMNALAALFIPLIALRFVVTWREIKQNLVFIYLSIISCVLPYVLLAKYNYEFPAIVGGMIGLLASILLSKKGIGLAPEPDQIENKTASMPAKKLITALFPLWGTITVLLVTRIEELGLKDFLTDATPVYKTALGSFADFTVSSSLVVGLKNIFGTESIWEYQTLYVPALIPFFFISFISFAIYKLSKPVMRQIASESYDRMKKPILALLGALVMVKLMMVGGEKSSVMLIGSAFAGATGERWQFFASYLGAVGSFFSGSATISNLTFSGIQNSIAQNLGLDRTMVLSAQSVGAAMGNMVSINNIVAVCSILGIINKEGAILKKTFLPTILYGVIAAIAGYFL
jgi:lactate permease